MTKEIEPKRINTEEIGDFHYSGYPTLAESTKLHRIGITKEESNLSDDVKKLANRLGNIYREMQLQEDNNNIERVIELRREKDIIHKEIESAMNMKQINVNDKVIVLKYSRTTEDTFTVCTVSPPNEFVSMVHYEIKEFPFDVFFSNELIKL